MVFTRASKKRAADNDEEEYPTEAPTKLPKRVKKELVSEAEEKKKTKYLNMPEGYGGKYSANDEMPYVGTKGCRTCIGVYFEINDKEYVLAHFNTQIQRPDDFEAEDELDHWRIDLPGDNTDAIFKEIRLSTASGLEEMHALHNTDPPTKRMRETLVIVCPQSGIPGEQYVGDAMIRGVKRWLRISKDDTIFETKTRKNEGFVVKFPGGEPKYFDGELEGFESVDLEETVEMKELDLVVNQNGRRVEANDEEIPPSSGDDMPSAPSLGSSALPSSSQSTLADEGA